jgi:hypothetical protein
MKTTLMIKCGLCLLISMVGFSATTHAGELVKIWPSSPPGYQTPPGEEGDKSKPTDRGVEGKPVIRIGNVSQPAVEVFLPPEGNVQGLRW